jgi:hypothetical protein
MPLISLTAFVNGFAINGGYLDRAVIIDVDLRAGFSMISRMTLPPVPITSRILSVGILIRTICGAFLLSSPRLVRPCSFRQGCEYGRLSPVPERFS